MTTSGKKFLSVSGAVLLSLAAAILLSVAGKSEERGASLRARAEARGFLIGAAVQSRTLVDDPDYAKLIARELNAVTAENAMKFRALRPARDRFNFNSADQIVDFAAAHGMKVRGHTLVW